MSQAPLTSVNNRTALQQPTAVRMGLVKGAPQPIASHSPEDKIFLNASVQPSSLGLFDWLLHPIQTYNLYRHLGKNSGVGQESFGSRLTMFRALRNKLSITGQLYLLAELKSGRLTDTKADDGRSTLSHLYTLANTPRAGGLDGKILLEDTLRLMNAPKTITQKFGTLKPENLNRLMAHYHSGRGPRITQNIDVDALRVTSSATCVASSLMYYMVKNNPSEFVRHISELTSPRMAFLEKVDAHDISPEDPSKAPDIFKNYEVTYAPAPGGQHYWVKVGMTESGLIRAINQQGSKDAGARGPVEAAYQAALTQLAVKSYDQGLDMRVNADGTLDPSKGLEEDRKTLMESIIKDNGGVMSVTYQFTASTPDYPTDAFLMGYYRNFEKTTQDLMTAVDAGEDVIIGITDTDRADTTGRINMGHELTVTGYERHPKTGEVIFTIADSDDNNPTLVKRAASEIVPKIHHAGFPVKQAQKIWGEINSSLNNQYLIPGQDDARRYQLVSTVPAQKQPAFLDAYQKMIQADEAQQAAAKPATSQPAQAPQQPAQYGTPVYYPNWQAYYRPVQYTPAYAYAYPTYNTTYTYPAAGSYYGYYNTPNYYYNAAAYRRA